MLPYWEFSEYHYLSIWQEGTMSLQREIQLLHRLIIGLSGSLAIFLLFTELSQVKIHKRDLT